MTLAAHGLAIYFGGVRAVDGVDITLEECQIIGLIGPNGAGKTTLLHALSGYVKPTHGRIELDGRETTRWRPERIARASVARTFQDVRVFRRLTVQQNAELGALNAGLAGAEAKAWTREVLARFQLEHVAHRAAGSLAHGDERRVGLARAVASRPRFLLLDEPAAGMNEDESFELAKSIGAIRNELSCGVLLVDHDMQVIMEACDTVHVLDAGKTLAVGTPRDVRRDPRVITAYLGERRSGRRRLALGR